MNPLPIRRQQQLESALLERGLDGLVVSGLANIFYLTGFRGSAGLAFFSASKRILWVDPRYTVQAQEQASGLDVRETKGGLLKEAGRWIGKSRFRRVGYEDSNLSCRQFAQLRDGAGRGVRWAPGGDLVESLRVEKDSSEIEVIRKACRLTSDVYQEVLKEVRPGVAELDLAAELEYRMKRQGAEGPAFETIVASGQRSALPHARPSSKLLEKDDLVIFDLGAILHGYAADMTRTVYLGSPNLRLRRMYRAVFEAQQKGVEATKTGVRAGDVDAAARVALRQRGLDRYFTHSTGHGVGIEIHEPPRLGRGQKKRLRRGSVLTVEPGIYIEGFGGIRIEDTVLLGAEGAEVLTPAPKEDWILS